MDFSDLPSIKFSNIQGPKTSVKRDFFEEMKRDVLEKQLQEAQYKYDILETLKRIERNTQDLQNIIQLLQTANSNQDKLFEVIVEILSISKAATPEEADSIYRDSITNIQQFNDDIDTMSKLLGMEICSG
jgi:Sec7-like guanine-nucleotide exchange factor